MSVAGGLFSGLGRGLMALAALRQAQDEETQRREIQNLSLAQQGIIPTADYDAQFGKGQPTSPNNSVTQSQPQPTESQLPNVQPAVVGSAMGDVPSQSYGSTPAIQALKAASNPVLKRSPGLETRQVGGYTIDPLIPLQRQMTAQETRLAPARAAAQQYMQTGDASGLLATTDNPAEYAYHYRDQADEPKGELRTFTDDQGRVTGGLVFPDGTIRPVDLSQMRGPTHRDVAAGGTNTPTALEVAATIDNADRAVGEMEDAFHANQQSAKPPTLIQTGLSALAGHVSPQFGEAAMQSMLSSPQVDFRGAAQRFLHNASGLQAKGGRSVALLNSLQNAYQAASGQDDPKVWGRFIQSARDFIDTYKAEQSAHPMRGTGKTTTQHTQTNPDQWLRALGVSP